MLRKQLLLCLQNNKKGVQHKIDRQAECHENMKNKMVEGKLRVFKVRIVKNIVGKKKR